MSTQVTDENILDLLNKCRVVAISQNEIMSLKHIMYVYLADKDTNLHQILLEQNVNIENLCNKILEYKSPELEESVINDNIGLIAKTMKMFSSQAESVSESLIFLKTFNDLYNNNVFKDAVFKEAEQLKNILNEFKITNEKIDEILTSNMDKKSDTKDPEIKNVKDAVRKRRSFLHKEGIDLTQKARDDNNFGKIFGRVEEVNSMVFALSKMRGNNVLLIGQPGVGKTELVRNLAKRIVNEDVPEHLRKFKIVELQVNKIIAGASLSGELEKRVDSVAKDLAESDDLILFLDEMHQLMRMGPNVPDILKPVLDTGCPVIGVTTFDEYNELVKKDRPFTRRFVSIKVDEMPEDKLVKVVKTLLPVYEDFHKVRLRIEHIDKILEIAKKYFPDIYAPANVISVLDTLFAMEKCDPPENIVKADEFKREMETLQEKIEEITGQETEDFQKRAEFAAKIAKLQNEIGELDVGDGTIEANPELAIKVVSRMTGIPESSVGSALIKKLPELNAFLKESISGQDEIIDEVSNSIIRSCLEINFGDGPKNVMMFLGPTGVGKTYMCQKINEFLFGNKEKMLRLDMSEFHGRHSINRLIGSAPGYVGYDQGGRLTNFVSDHPHGLVLLDEIEKAHPDVLHAFLQVFDAGRMTDGRGREVNFKHSIIIMTSNIGSEAIIKDIKDLGFIGVQGTESERDQRNKEKVFKVLEDDSNGFTPEFLNRIPDKIVFKVLSEESIVNIVSNQVQEVVEKISKHGVKLSVDKRALKVIAKEGYDKKYGARNISRTIITLLSNPVSISIASGEYQEGDKIKVSAKENKLVFSKKGK